MRKPSRKPSMFLQNSPSLNWQWIIMLKIKYNCFNISKKKNLNAQLNNLRAPCLQSSQAIHLRELLLATAGKIHQGNAALRCNLTVISKTRVIWWRKKIWQNLSSQQQILEAYLHINWKKTILALETDEDETIYHKP